MVRLLLEETVGRKRVLVVEDEPCIREILEEFLDILGFDVVLASNGKEGLILFQNSDNFDLYLLDIKLPKLSGLELAKLIRERDKEHPIVFLTGLMESHIGFETSKIYRAYHLKKPITFADLKDIFQQAGLL